MKGKVKEEIEHFIHVNICMVKGRHTKIYQLLGNPAPEIPQI